MWGSRFLTRLRGAWRAKPFWALPLALYLATCCTTTFVGYIAYGSGSFARALWFSVPLMTILTCHESGHYFQLRRLRIETSLPFFLPLPLPPLGTFGAVMRIRRRLPDRRALFDVGVSGPAAGLVASLVFLVLGLSKSTLATAAPVDDMACLTFGAPLVMQWATQAILGDGSDGARFVLLHPCAIAAWVGLFLTSLNLIPIGQLDGGHAIYSLLGRRSRWFSLVVLVVVCAIAAIYRFWGWFVFVALVVALGFKRFSTGNDARPLGLARSICAWFAMAYLIVGFAPCPVAVDESANVADEAAATRIVEEAAPTPGPLVFHVGLTR